VQAVAWHPHANWLASVDKSKKAIIWSDAWSECFNIIFLFVFLMFPFSLNCFPRNFHKNDCYTRLKIIFPVYLNINIFVFYHLFLLTFVPEEHKP
jgi:hypothetical protein